MLEGDEVFDSNMLKQMVESMIASGKRNITVELTQLDYLYSDAINALIVINKRMLDVMGRLSLLGPQPPVLEILKKSGVQNILKIFLDEAELIRTSEELSGMAAAPAPAPMAPPPQPQSEFDQLRSEIDSAFEPGPAAPPPVMPQRPQPAPQYQPPQRPAFTPPPVQQQYTPPPPAGPVPRYAPPPPLRPFEPAAQKPQARAYTPPPPKPAAPAFGAETRRMPPVPEASMPVRPQPGPISVQPEEDLEKFEATLEKKAAAPEKPARDRFDDFEDTPKKKSFVPILVVLLVLLAIAGGGYYYIAIVKGKEKPVATPTPAATETQKPEGTVPQLPVESGQLSTPAAAAPAETKVSEPVKEEVKKTEPAKEVAKKAEPAKKKTPEVAARPKPVSKPAVTKPAIPEPAIRRPPPEPEPEPVVETPPVEPTPKSNIEVFDEPPPPPPRPAPVVERPAPIPPPAPAETASPAAAGEAASVFIASIPPVADIYMDGKLIGKTNISELKVAAGTHSLRFVKGDKEKTEQMTFTPGKNPSKMVRIP